MTNFWYDDTSRHCFFAFLCNISASCENRTNTSCFKINNVWWWRWVLSIRWNILRHNKRIIWIWLRCICCFDCFTHCLSLFWTQTILHNNNWCRVYNRVLYDKPRKRIRHNEDTIWIVFTNRISQIHLWLTKYKRLWQTNI